MSSPHPVLRGALLLGALLLPALPAWALYKVVGPDGQVTFTDIPPADAGAKTVQDLGDGGSAPNPDLPYALQQVVQRYPAVVYTTPQCPACADAVQLLRQRGVPYTEKSITTAADVQAYHGVSHDADKVPLLTLGGTVLKPGFDRNAWSQALTDAGYPRESLLPPTYRFAAPQALTAPAPAASRPAAHRAHPAAPQPSAKPPPGIQF